MMLPLHPSQTGPPIIGAQIKGNSTSANNMSERDAIPHEILLAIIDPLAPPQLALCARASRSFYLTVTPLLYRSVLVDLAGDINPLVNRSKLSISARHRRSLGLGAKFSLIMERMRLGKDRGDGSARKGSKGEGEKNKEQAQTNTSTIAAPAAPTTLPNRFSSTKHLTIVAHIHIDCQGLPSLIMPLLRDLRILPGGQDHLDFCKCRHFTPKMGRCTQPIPCVCPLISQLHPHRLLIGSEFTGLSGSALGLTNLNSPFPQPWIKELVVFAGFCTGIETNPQAEFFWLDDIPLTVEKLSIVLQPVEGIWATDGKWRFREVAGYGDCSFPAQLLWDRLGMALSGNAGMMEVVGLETVDTDWTELSLQLEEEEIRKAVKAKLVDKGWKDGDAAERAKAVHFLSRAEFDRRLGEGKE